jgi:nucleoside 2-deoxyribosyltransferase
MKYYIATKLERHLEHNAVRDAMRALGHQLTYDWTVHGSVWRAGVETIRKVAVLERRGVLDADVVIVLLPGGRGTHAELGMALAAEKPVLLCSSDPALFGATPETCAFYHHRLCEQIVAAPEDLARAASERAHDLWVEGVSP